MKEQARKMNELHKLTSEYGLSLDDSVIVRDIIEGESLLIRQEARVQKDIIIVENLITKEVIQEDERKKYILILTIIENKEVTSKVVTTRREGELIMLHNRLYNYSQNL